MSALTLEDFARNALLATLSDSDRERLMPHMLVFDCQKWVDMSEQTLTITRGGAAHQLHSLGRRAAGTRL